MRSKRIRKSLRLISVNNRAFPASIQEQDLFLIGNDYA